MKHKYISTRSNEILFFFNQKEQYCFDYSEAQIALPNSGSSALKELLSDMTRRGLLMRLKKGVYYIIPYEKDSDSFMPDWHLLAKPLTKGSNHYIGYYSAMQIHNLITQPSLKEQIVVSKQIKPSVLNIKNIDFQFIYHNPTHFFGYEKIWIDSYNQVLCSDLEKTFIDGLFKPEYAGGIIEIAKAIYLSKDTIDYKKLLEYTEKFGSQAVMKRLGFLLELLNMNPSFCKKIQKNLSPAYIVLDTELPKEGKHIDRWKIQQNIDTETIKSAIYS